MAHFWIPASDERIGAAVVVSDEALRNLARWRRSGREHVRTDEGKRLDRIRWRILVLLVGRIIAGRRSEEEAVMTTMPKVWRATQQANFSDPGSQSDRHVVDLGPAITRGATGPSASEPPLVVVIENRSLKGGSHGLCTSDLLAKKSLCIP
jgi:hypothetical protein